MKKCPQCKASPVEMIGTILYRYKVRGGSWRSIALQRTYRCRSCKREWSFNVRA